MEPQLPNLPAEVAGVRLTECLGVLGEQADEEVDSTKVAVSKAFQPRPHLGLNLNLVQIAHASDAICISRYRQAGSQGDRPVTRSYEVRCLVSVIRESLFGMTDVGDASEELTGQALPPGYGSVNPFVAVRGGGHRRCGHRHQ